jgi:hypothetical protein
MTKCSPNIQKIFILEITFTNHRENIIKQENKHIVNIRSLYKEFGNFVITLIESVRNQWDAARSIFFESSTLTSSTDVCEPKIVLLLNNCNIGFGFHLSPVPLIMSLYRRVSWIKYYILEYQILYQLCQIHIVN